MLSTSPARRRQGGDSIAAPRPGDASGGVDRFDLVAAGVLAALAWLFYSAVLRLWWTNDDFFHLHFILIHPPFSYCYRPAVWRQLPFQMITPFLFASLELDLSIFGLAPRSFYVHQLLVVSLVAAAFYLVLRMWLPRRLALAGGFLLLVGPPLTASVGLIMVRHYLEGALLAMVATGLFVRALRTRRRGFAILSAFLYLMAALEKEIFVPLVLVLVALPEGRWQERLRCALPHLVGLTAYVGYRVFMLGVLVGGYGWVISPRDLSRLGLQLPGKMLADLAGGQVGTPAGAQALGWAVIAILGAAAVAGLVLRPGTIVVTVVGMLAAVLPVLPVSTHLHVRYALAAWIAAVVAGLFGCDALAARRGWAAGCAGALAVAACCAAGLAARPAWARSLGELERMSEEGRLFVAMPAGSVLRNPLGPGSTFSELRWFKEQVFGLAKGTRWSYDDFLLCTRPAPAARVWSYDAGRRRLAEVTADLPRLCRQYLATVRPQAPLAASFEGSEGQLLWHLGPFAAGQYAFLLADGAALLPVARDAGYGTRGAQSISLQVRYESPAGWVTYSPAFNLDLSRHLSMRWHRGGRG